MFKKCAYNLHDVSATTVTRLLLILATLIDLELDNLHQNNFYTSTKSWRGYIFIAVCLCVCLCVRNSCEQNSSRTDAPILTRFLLNGCLQHWHGPNWNWWPWVKGQGHSDAISFFLYNSLLTSLLGMRLRRALSRFGVEFHKNQIWDDARVTSFKFSPLNCQHLNSAELTNFFFGTDIQQHKIHLMTKVLVTLITGEGQRSHKINKWWYLVKH